MAICASGDFTKLIGEIENLEFDCKAAPYMIADDKNKRELAKDVSAFANVAGGLILIGIKTQPSTSHFGDEVVAIQPFASGLVNPIQYVDVLSSWIYPPVAGLTVKWIEMATDPTKGVVVIDIPPQTNSLKPFLITKTIDGSKVVESVFGYAARKGDTSPPLGVKELQQHLNAGLAYDANLDSRLSAIDAGLKEILGSSKSQVQAKALAVQLTTAINTALHHGNLDKRRAVVLYAQPIGAGKLSSIFSSEKNSIKRKVERPPVLRDNGWTIETLDTAKIIQGKSIRVTNGNRKVLDLYVDGTMTFAASADDDFIGWGKPGTRKLHPLALAEVAYSFAALYREVLGDFESPIQEVRFGVQLHGMHLGGQKSVLRPGNHDSMSQQFELETHEAPTASFDNSYVEPVAGFDPEIVAYEIVRMIYLWFGLDEESVPYAVSKGGRLAINSAAIAKY